MNRSGLIHPGLIHHADFGACSLIWAHANSLFKGKRAGSGQWHADTECCSARRRRSASLTIEPSAGQRSLGSRR